MGERLVFLEVLASQVFLVRPEIWDPKDPKEQEEEGVRKVTEEKWDCQEEKEIRGKREKLEQRDLLGFLALKGNLGLLDLLDHLVLRVLLENFHYFLLTFFSKEIHLKPTEDQREKFGEILLMEKSNPVHKKTAMWT